MTTQRGLGGSFGEVFTLNMGMIIPQCGEIGTGKFPHSSLKAHFIFTIHGLAVGVKIKFPHSRLRLSWGNFVFTPPAAPFMVKIKCAFRDSWRNLFFPFRGFATQGEKSRPYFSTLRDWHISRLGNGFLGKSDIIAICFH